MMPRWGAGRERTLIADADKAEAFNNDIKNLKKQVIIDKEVMTGEELQPVICPN